VEKEELALNTFLGNKLRLFTGEVADVDLSRRVYLLFFISIIGVANLIPLGLLAIFERNYTLGMLDLSLAIILTFNLVHAKVYRRFEWNIGLGIAFTAVLFLFAFITGGENQTGFVWFYAFPLISSFLLGTRNSLVLNLGMLLPVLVLFLASPDSQLLAAYHFDFKVRFVPSYLVVVFFAFLAERARENSRRSLAAAHDILDDRVRERTAQLREANTDLEREVGERRKAEEDLSDRVNLLTLTSEVGNVFTRNDPLPDMLRKCAEALVEDLDAAFARIWLLDEQSGILELQASAGMYTHLDGQHSRVALGELKIGKIASEGIPVLTNAVVDDPNISDQDWVKREGMVSFAGHPLHVSGKLVGVMALFSKKPLSPSVLQSLSAIADQMAIGINRKQTENKLVYSEEYLRSIVNTEPECVKLVDENGIVVDMNPSGLKMLEAELPEQVVGKFLYDLIATEHRETTKAFMKEALHGPGGTMQFRVVGLKGGSRWLETHAVPFEDSRNGQTLVLAVTRDITDIRDAVESLREVKEDLERRNEELKKLDKMKSAFIYAVSHELKTPVSKHIMQLEILKPLLKKYELSSMEKKSIRVMEESIKRQQDVVRNLLSLSRLESGKRPYRTEEVILDELLEAVRKEYEYALESFGVDIDMEASSIRLWTDGDMLWHVLSNLVNNAIKFRRKDGQPRITVRASTRKGSVTMSIRDNGVGLSDADKGKAFERFFQSSTSIEGTGVGLTICKMIVEGLGGKILLESKGKGLGTTAILEFPSQILDRQQEAES
jgi:PAS domain S-box-containing protein